MTIKEEEPYKKGFTIHIFLFDETSLKARLHKDALYKKTSHS